MALSVHLLAPKPFRIVISKFPTNPPPSYSSSSAAVHFINPKSPPKHPTATSCIGDKSEANLASKFAAEVEKVNARVRQREEALHRSRELLFKELSSYMGLRAEEAKKKWRKMEEGDRLALIKGFVSEWSDNFHPLSARSAKELVDEYLTPEKPSVVDYSGKLIGGT